MVKNRFPNSKVVRRIYPSSDPEQKSALEDDETLRNYAQARQRKSSDIFRPAYHFVNPENTMNDPNGLCFWKGYWHLFYQVRPPVDERLHWGHAYSNDLIHWKDLPNAIFPGPENDCYSGTVLIEDDRAIAMYHGIKLGNMVAISEDQRLLNWTKLGDRAVIPFDDEHENKPYGIFDPFIWSEDGIYYSLSAGIRNGRSDGSHRAENFLFRSKDLLNWEFVHEFVEGDTFTIDGDDGACPYFLPIADKHILIFFSHMTGAQYLIGDYDRQRLKFLPTGHGRFNFGTTFPCGVHAPSAFSLECGDVVIVFNMNTGLPINTLDNYLKNYYGENRCEEISAGWHEKSRQLGWDQIMTLPRRLSLQPDGRLSQMPFSAVESCRDGHAETHKNVVVSASDVVQLDGVYGDTIELTVTVDLLQAQSFSIRVFVSEDMSEFSEITVYRNRGKIFRTPKSNNIFAHKVMSTAISNMVKRYSVISVDITNSSLDRNFVSRPPEIAEYEIDEHGITTLRIFLDRSVIELFADQQTAIAVRTFPSLDSSKQIHFLARGSACKLLDVRCWQMASIYASAD